MFKTVEILGANRFDTYTKTRDGSRAIIIRDDKILLSHETVSGWWLIPGGGMEAGETPEECVVREVEEETGMIVQTKEQFLVLHEYYEEYRYTSYYFVCEVTGESHMNLTEEEKRRGLIPEWIPLKEAIDIFSKHESYADTSEEKRGSYLREYMALTEYTDYLLQKSLPDMEGKMKKYQINTIENREFLKGLREDLFSFGKNFPSPGGSSYYLGDDGTPWKDRPRETWITSRMAHVYSMAALMGREGGAALAEAAINGLINELHDDDNGGWYAGIYPDGSILPGKQCYAHAFVILAASSAMLAGIAGAEELFRDAIEIYDRFFWNEEEGLSADTWDTAFTKLSSYRGLNANMHTVEAFLAASDVSSDEKYRIRAGRIIDRVIGWAEDNNWRIPEHFDDSWNVCLNLNEDKPDDQFKPFGATPGHGIEWARLIIQWALSTYGKDNEDAKKYITAARHLYDHAIKDAWFADGAPGLCYTTDWNGVPVVHDRMHWTLAEAINTSAVLYRVTADPKYAGDYEMFMEYLDRYVVDHENTSWFHQLDSDNRPIGTVWPGKPDLYHAVQATLIPYVEDTAVSVAATI